MPKVGEVWSVTGGYGLMLVLEVDASICAVAMGGHGYQSHWAPHWFAWDRLATRATPEIIERERQEARARGVECNSPDCWCRKGVPHV